ncbi:related to DUF6 domain protein [Ramularia collo-cygni]|uniref:Related to DUF6 domain protein n=1 Tax=Ramularia collo-cygni TaxID=112498 RepID=A0A2D3UWN3_9PEZI|nr:related to DUF6 domain protein [Ramularia collo-cygni]CZT21201.1 related to DUF6 domain protein [Ramularia collo-cygni]
MEGQYKSPPANCGFLSAQLAGPRRPLSPDTLSIISTEGYDQIHHVQQPPCHINHSSPSDDESQPGWRYKLRRSWTRNYGLFLMLLAQFFGTCMNVTVRLLEVEGNEGKGMHPFQILFARMAITVILASLYMYYRKTPHFPFGHPDVRTLLVARGTTGFFGVFGMYYSLLYLPLSDATVITFLAPGLACWACSYLIKEPFTRVEKIGTLISLVGVLFIARPTTFFHAFGGTSPAAGVGDMAPFGQDPGDYDNVTPIQRLIGVGVALVGVAGTAGAITTIRWIGKRAHPLISVNYFAIWCTLVSFVMQLAIPSVGFLLPANLKEWGYLIFLGICGFVMQFLLAASLSYEKSSRATNIVYCQMIFALGFDELIFGHLPNVLSIIGSSLILGAAIFVALQKKDPATSTATTEREPLLRDEEAGLEAGRLRANEHGRPPV